MPWYVNTLEAFAVTHVRPAPPERVDDRRAADDDRQQRLRAAPERPARRAS